MVYLIFSEIFTHIGNYYKSADCNYHAAEDHFKSAEKVMVKIDLIVLNVHLWPILIF